LLVFPRRSFLWRLHPLLCMYSQVGTEVAVLVLVLVVAA
jgi:hypothetical protein